jgi:lipid II:glycine glycyltransferase (peptidoglycan interpeptide bridge formation enzyme)
MGPIRFLDRAPENWDNSVLQASETVEFAESMKTFPNYVCLYALDENNNGNRAIVILQRFYPLLRVVSARSQVFTSSQDSMFMKHILDYLKRMKVPYVRIGNGMWGLKDSVELSNFRTRVIERHTFLIDLTRKEDELWKALDKKTRNAIRRAEKENVVVKEIETENELSGYIALSQKTGERIRTVKGVKSFPTLRKRFFSAVYDNMAKKGYAKFVVAKYGDDTIAGGLFFTFNKAMLYYHGCSSHDVSRLQAPSAIQWFMITRMRAQGIETYDLGGTAPGLDERDSRFFVHEFKRKWGGELRKFYNIEVVLSPLRNSMLNLALKLLRKS